MKLEELKLYSKYKNINNPNIEYIYIGIDKDDGYWFLYKYENTKTYFSTLKRYGFDSDKIVNDLNLEIVVYSSDNKYIKGYDWKYCTKQHIEKHFKPILKDKLKNIINR